MSHIQLSDQAQLSIYSDIKSKKSIQMAFLNRQSERISLKGGGKELDWQINEGQKGKVIYPTIRGFQG